MVSKAKDDFPEPLGPVITTSLLRGSFTLTFLRLCCAASVTTRLSIMRARVAQSFQPPKRLLSQASFKLQSREIARTRRAAGRQESTFSQGNSWPVAAMKRLN